MNGQANKGATASPAATAIPDTIHDEEANPFRRVTAEPVLFPLRFDDSEPAVELN